MVVINFSLLIIPIKIQVSTKIMVRASGKYPGRCPVRGVLNRRGCRFRIQPGVFSQDEEVLAVTYRRREMPLPAIGKLYPRVMLSIRRKEASST